ncbi:MAG: hypothetical protein H7343_13265 [Undibacterium sp.]|nr:hypothetical protein [Opitutaceae bacterium]
MSASAQLSAETIACLRDEAYVHLCRQFLTQELTRLESEKAQIMTTRPPFGLLASKKSRGTYELSLDSALRSEAEIRAKLHEVDRLDHCLKSKLQDALNDYLAIVNPDHHLFSEISSLVDRWQNSVGALSEHALAFARDLRAAAKPDLTASQSIHTLAVLRSAAAYLHSEAAKVHLIAEKASSLSAGKLPAGTRLPALPPFRPSTWVDRTFALVPARRAVEFDAAEVEARAFCTAGKNDLLIQAEQTRAASLHTRQAFLDRYWEQLRAHALQHYVKPRDVDEVIIELSARHLSGDIERHQLERIRNPFGIGD